MWKFDFDVKKPAMFFVDTVLPMILTGQLENPVGLAASAAACILDSFSKKEETMLSNLEAVRNQAVQDSNLDPDSRDMLLSQLKPQVLIDFMCQPDADDLLAEHIQKIRETSSEYCPYNFPISDVVKNLRQSFEAKVFESPELANYMTYRTLQYRTRKEGIYTANQEYENAFKSPMFLHKNSPKVTLQNLYIMPKYYNHREKVGISHDDLEDYLKQFIHDPDRKFLLIEGDAGCGKTSLTAWLNADGLSILGNLPLVTVRLRDLDKKSIAEHQSLVEPILDYMHLSSLDALEMHFPRAVLCLDGFDELCMIDGLEGQHDKLLWDLYQKDLENFHILVTSRPNFIAEDFAVPCDRILLPHFDEEQRDRWIQHYTSADYCGQNLDPAIQNYIEEIDEDSVSNICDTPMTLYMLAAKKGSSQYLNNSWDLYHHIFFEELSKTEYNKMFPNPTRDYAHSIQDVQDFLYAISEEIAYRMYRRQNKTLYLNREELSEIITELKPRFPHMGEADLQKITEHSYGLCCYWKNHGTDGAVEFLHNNIRDFFLAEKIYREMDELYNDRSLSSDKIVEKLCMLLNPDLLEDQTLEFLYCHFQNNKVHGISDFPQKEHQHSFLSSIMKELNGNGILKNNALSVQSPYCLLDQIRYLLRNIMRLYRMMYEFHRKKDEYIPWSPYTSRYRELFSELFPSMFSNEISLSSLSNNSVLIGLGEYGNFQFCCFDKSFLSGVNFYCTNLSHCSFYHSNLRHACLQYANLQDATLMDTDLQNSNLTGAILTGADLRYAHLENAILPDGFTSPNQEEQLNHLSSLHISNLILDDDDYFLYLANEEMM